MVLGCSSVRCAVPKLVFQLHRHRRQYGLSPGLHQLATPSNNTLALPQPFYTSTPLLHIVTHAQNRSDDPNQPSGIKNDNSPLPSSSPSLPPSSLVTTSTLFYGGMTCISLLLGRKYDITGQLFNASSFDLQATLPYFGALGVMFVVSTVLSETVPAFQELKKVYQKFLIPQLKQSPWWGMLVLAVGAGVGEETLFRGLMQSWLIEQAGHVPAATPASSIAAGLVTTSVVFGALHALTPAYAIFATIAGVIFGVQYLNCGLPAAAFTHAMYDFVALVTILQTWGAETSSEVPRKD